MEKKFTYFSPAEEWIEGLPLGNGTVGAMVYGRAEETVFALNHKDLYEHKPRKKITTAARRADLERLVKAGAGREVNDLFCSTVSEHTESAAFLPFCDLCCRIDGDRTVTDYRRVLDPVRGEATLSFRIGDTAVAVCAFCDLVNGWFTFRYTCSAPLGFRLRFSREEAEGCRTQTVYEDGQYFFRAAYAPAPSFLAAAEIRTDGGKSAEAGDVKIAEATVLEVRVSLSVDPAGDKIAPPEIDREDFAGERAAHGEKCAEAFGRCVFSLDLPDFADTGEYYRQARKNDRAPAGMYEKAADMARYVLISSEREGTAPCNLQGIWNHDMHPAWSSGYTTDMNLQMHRFCALPGRLPEALATVEDWLWRNLDRMEEEARALFGVPGALYLPQWTDLYMEPTCWRDYGAFQMLWAGAAAWTVWAIAEKEDYLPGVSDEKLLPLLLRAFRLYAGVLTPGDDGKLHNYLSASPENFPEDNAMLIDTATMDISLVRALGERLLRRLPAESDERAQVVRILSLLPDYPLDEDGALAEWCDPRPPRDPGHRHLSHIWCLYPGDECDRSPALRQAAERALDKRVANNHGQAAAWSQAWEACLYAKLGRAKEAEDCMDTLFRGAVIGNMLSVYAEFSDPKDPEAQLRNPLHARVFQADAMLGFYAALLLCVVQSDGERITLLPALPPVLRAGGRLSGVGVKGGFVADISWKDGRVTAFSLKSLHGENKRVLLCLPAKEKLPAPAEEAGEGVYALLLTPGAEVKFTL